MRTAESTTKCFLLLMLLLLPARLEASREMSFDLDVRSRLTEGKRPDVELYVMGGSVRQIFSDNSGDRVILLGLFEAEQNFSMLSIHEIYGRYKGPLARWNVTAGRFGLPYGLLNNFRTSRLLYRGLHDHTIGMEVDNGVMVSGLRGSLDYAVSVTQGYGAHHALGFPGHGLIVSRLGLVLGEAEEVVLGISGAFGKTSGLHQDHATVARLVGGIDGTLYMSRLLGRIEWNAGEVDKRPMTAGFLSFDYSLFPTVSLNIALSQSWHESEHNDLFFVGFDMRTRFATLRGGYRYEHITKTNHQIVFQCYRLFSSAR